MKDREFSLDGLKEIVVNFFGFFILIPLIGFGFIFFSTDVELYSSILSNVSLFSLFFHYSVAYIIGASISIVVGASLMTLFFVFIKIFPKKVEKNDA